jgi:hypothetical protein
MVKIIIARGERVQSTPTSNLTTHQEYANRSTRLVRIMAKMKTHVIILKK